MTAHRRFFVCALLAPALLTGNDEQEIAFGPSADTRLTKTLETGFDFTLESLSLVVDGEDIGAMMGGIDFAVSTEQTVVVSDVYGEVAHGRPLNLVRTFEELGALVNISVISEFGDHEQDVESTSELLGRTVRFAWNEEEGEYQVDFEDEDGGTELLEGLREDIDFRILLPDGEVAEGDSWEVALGGLEDVAAPGGNMALLPQEAEVQDFSAIEDLFTERFSDIEDLLEGEWTCTFGGLSAEDSRLAEIQIETELGLNVDFSDVILDLVDIFAQEAGEEVPDISVETAEGSFDFTGQGLLIWNVAANRFVSFELTGEAAISIDISVSLDVADKGHDAELYLEMSGPYSHSATASE